MTALGQLRRFVAPIARRLRLVVTRGVVTSVEDEAAQLRKLQVALLAGDVRSAIEHFETYGWTARPRLGAEVLAFALGASTDHTVIGAAPDRRYRPTDLADGEVVVYGYEGQTIRLKPGRVIEIEADTIKLTAGGSTIEMDAAGVRIDGTEIRLNEP